MNLVHYGKFGFRSISARLFISVFLALLTFTIAFVLLSQFAHNNSDYTRNRAIASQIMNQIEPFFWQRHTLYQLKIICFRRDFLWLLSKKSFDIF